MWWPTGMGGRDTMVWRRLYLSAVWIGVGVGHVGRHVSMILVIMGTCPAPLLVHVGVVCVGWWQRVEVVGAVVSGGCLTSARGTVG